MLNEWLDQVVLFDCQEALTQLPEACADLIIADPPYNLNKDFGIWKETEQKHRWLDWCKAWLRQCERILKPGGSIFVYGIHHHLCWLQCYLYELNLVYRRQIIWFYENGFSGYTKSLSAQYEPLLWFSKGRSYTYHPIREPYKSTERLKHRIIKNGRVWKPNPLGRLGGDVWRFPTLAGPRFRDEKVEHPTQKPLSISNRLVRHFSNVGDLVVVPFAGSGSECVAAKCDERHFIGFDVNPTYVELANTRLGGAKRTLDPSPKAASTDAELFQFA